MFTVFAQPGYRGYALSLFHIVTLTLFLSTAHGVAITTGILFFRKMELGCTFTLWDKFKDAV
jgi:hypothetical protein